MHFHLPKPLHGWRAFLGEVGIIVLGVLIALSAESVAENLSWRSRVAGARQELRYELGHNFVLLNDRLKETQCVESRLNELAKIVTGASDTGRLPPVGQVGSPSVYSWPNSVWQSQMSAQTATHFPPLELGTIARVYRDFADLREENLRERAAWLKLATISGPGRAAGPDTIDRLIQALAEARSYNSTFTVWEHIIVRVMKQGHLGRNFAQIDANNPPVLNANEAICRALGPAPAAYGQ